MAFGESVNVEAPRGLLPKREPLWLLAVGVLLFATLLALTWYPGLQQNRTTDRGFSESLAASSATRFIEFARYQQLRGSFFGRAIGSSLNDLAIQTAERWLEVGRTSTDPDYRAKTAINAAALYGTAGNAMRAREILAADNLGLASARLEIAALFLPSSNGVPLSSHAMAVLDEVSGGTLIRAYQAQQTGGMEAQIIALQPGARKGLRVIIIILALEAGVGLLLLTAVILGMIHYRRITSAMALAAEPPAAPTPWGIGAALTVVALVYLLTRILAPLVVQGVIHLTGLAEDERLILLTSAVMTIITTVVVLGIFLVAQGRSPWNWGAFGWQFSWWHVRYGLVGLLIAAPVYGIVAWVSVMLFKDRAEPHPLIPMLQSTRDPWTLLLLVLMAVVMAPLIEETLFRGVLFRACHNRIAFWPAALLSGALFAAGHGQLVALLPIFVLGVLFALLARRAGSLWAAAVAHGAFNGFSTLVALLMAWALR